MHWQVTTDSLLAPLINAERLGIITDFDGTLSEIVDEPDAAHIAERSRDALAALRPKLALLAVVSGRGAAAIHRMTGLDGVVYVGNHGMERWVDGGVQVPERVAAYRPNLEAVLAGLTGHVEPGIRLEDKGATASVHYRQAANPTAAAERLRPLLERLTTENEIGLHSGKMVFELRPPLDTDKGTAFRALVAEYNLTAAVYLGDDVTDAAALRAAQQMRDENTVYALGLGVRHPDDTPQDVLDASDVLADGVDDVSAFFDWLLNALSASST